MRMRKGASSNARRPLPYASTADCLPPTVDRQPSTVDRRPPSLDELPVRPIVTAERRVHEPSPHHLDRHPPTLQDRVVELLVRHPPTTHELTVQRADLETAEHVRRLI